MLENCSILKDYSTGNTVDISAASDNGLLDANTE